MAKSQRPRVRELRDLYRLTGECCELGADPLAWRQHMVDGLLKLFDADVVVHSRWDQVGPMGSDDWLQPRLLVDAGWASESDRDVCLEFMRQRDVDVDGFWATPEFSRIAPSAEHRRRFVSDRDWYRGTFFNEVFRRCHLDDTLVMGHRLENQLHIVCVQRGLGEAGFELRQVRLFRLFMLEYIQLFGSKLAPLDRPSVLTLPAQQRRVLYRLMDGDSEKQVAQRLGISRHTVHNYVKQLHTRFGVSSRGELLSLCRPLWPVFRGFEGDDVHWSSGKFKQ